MKCGVCSKEFSSKSPKAMYCPDCKKVLRGQWLKEHRSRQRYAAMINHKNDSTYGKNKTILFDYQWGTIVYGQGNYIVIRKIISESHNSNDIWAVIRNAIKRGRCTYYSRIEGALFAVYDRIQSGSRIDRSCGFAKRVLSLRNMIIDTDFNGYRQSFNDMLLNKAAKKGYGSDLFSLKKAIIDVKKELSEATSKPSDRSLGRIDTDGFRHKNEDGLKQ